LSAQVSTLGRMASRGTEKESTTGCTLGEGDLPQRSSWERGGLSHQHGGTLPRMGSRWEGGTMGGTGGEGGRHRVHHGVGEA
jgi:hypothetical protein